MRSILLIFACFYSFFAFSQKLILSLGEKAFLPLPKDYVVKVGNKKLIDIIKNQNRLSITAKKKGTTFLIGGERVYEIFIFEKSKKKKILKFKSLIDKLWGLDWSLSKDNIFQIDGTLNRVSDWIELSQLSERLNFSYHFKALPGEGLKPMIQTYMKNYFPDSILLDILWTRLPFVSVPKGEELSKYEKFLKPFGLVAQENSLWFGQKDFMTIEVAIIEQLSSSGFGFGGSSQEESILSSFTSLVSFLKFLKNSGQGKTIHHSRIVGQSGQTIQIHSGGQIPFSSYNSKTEQQHVQWKSYGLKFNFYPKIDKKKQIQIKIKVDVSEPLPHISMEKPPALKSQSFESILFLKDQQIVPLFRLSKSSKGSQTKSHLSLFSILPNFFLSGHNQYKMTQIVFLQVKIKGNKEWQKK